MATVLKTTKIRPQSGLSLPLVVFDMIWYDSAANQSLLFFDFPCSKLQFSDIIIPQLEKSLSLTLSHFPPLAGNIIHPFNPAETPVLRYESTDSVSFRVAESAADFSRLAGNHPRNCDEFYPLAPVLPPPVRSESSVSCPVLAVQATLFPGQGLSMGFVTHHAAADASTVVSFIRAWALINKTDSGAALVENTTISPPFFDRKTVTNINGLDSIYWEEIVKFSCTPEPPPPLKLPTGKIRTTFVLKRNEIEKLKELVRAKCRGVVHISSFTVVCALVWVSSATAGGAAAAAAAADETEYFTFVADCRERLKPPLPGNYFGNCVAVLKAELRRGEVEGDEGFVKAAAAIGAVVRGFIDNEKGAVDGAESWPEEFMKLVGKKVYAVAGSPRFDFYGADFGWGKPRKFEALFIDGGESETFSLCKSRDSDGGLEIGFSKKVVEMDAFARVFNQLIFDLVYN